MTLVYRVLDDVPIRVRLTSGASWYPPSALDFVSDRTPTDGPKQVHARS